MAVARRLVSATEMRPYVLILSYVLGLAACADSDRASPDLLAEPTFVAAVDTLVHLGDVWRSDDQPHPGPAAVRAVELAIRSSAPGLKQAAIAALDDSHEQRRLRAHLALQTIGVSDDELRQLAASPILAVRMWAILARDGFPLAPRPVDVSYAASPAEGRALVERHALAVRRLLACDEETLQRYNDEFREEYVDKIAQMLDRPAEHLAQLFVRRADVTGDNVDDWVCSGRLATERYGFVFLLVVDGRNDKVLVEAKFDQTMNANEPTCFDVDGDGRPEVLIDRYIGNPLSHYLHVFGIDGNEPTVFADRFVTLIEDPEDGAVWFVETSPFNEYGGTASMLMATYGAEHRVTRLSGGRRVAAKLTLYTDVTSW